LGGGRGTDRQRERNEYRSGAEKGLGQMTVGLPLPSTKMFKSNKI